MRSSRSSWRRSDTRASAATMRIATLTVAAEARVTLLRHELRELRMAHVDQRRVIAALEINFRRLIDAVVDHDIEPVALAESRHCAAIAIREQALDLILTGQIDILADLSSEIR